MAWVIPIANTSTTINLNTTDSLFVSEQILVGNVIGSGTNQKVIVAGTIASASDGIYLLAGSGHLVKVEAAGEVRGFSLAGVGFTAANVKLENDGYIFGAAEGVFLSGGDATTTATIVNDGTIESSNAGIFRAGDLQAISILNTGIIQGDGYSFRQNIVADDARDIIVNNGTMVGKIDFGGGADTYDGRLGTIQGSVLGGAGADKLYSGSGNNQLYGQDGDDTLMGGVGADYLSGGTGSDRASYASATKAVIVSLSNTSINKGDAAGDTYNSVENLSGSNFNDFVYGNSAGNAINGGAGNDTIKGYAGNDTLTGGNGSDTFNFNTALNVMTNVDIITDYSVSADTIQLDNSVFTVLSATGVLAASAFAMNGTGNAADSSDRIIYETDTGNLYYDRDGTASSYDSVHFATLPPGLSLTNADFIVV